MLWFRQGVHIGVNSIVPFRLANKLLMTIVFLYEVCKIKLINNCNVYKLFVSNVHISKLLSMCSFCN